MGNDNNKVLNKIPRISAMIFGVVSIFWIFTPNLYLIANPEETGLHIAGTYFSGLDIAFGKVKSVELAWYVDKILVWDSYYIEVCFSASPVILTYLLVIAGSVCAVLDLLGKGGKVVSIVACVCFGVAAVLFFISNYLVMLNIQPNDNEILREIRNNLKLNFGAVAGGVFCIVASLSSLAAVFVDKKREAQ